MEKHFHESKTVLLLLGYIKTNRKTVYLITCFSVFEVMNLKNAKLCRHC